MKLYGLFFASICAVALAACSNASKAGSSADTGSATGSGGTAVVGRVAPSFSAPTADGARLTLASFRGKPVYLNFFATWCGPCNEEAPDINVLQKQYASRGLRIVGVDELEDAKKAAAFVKKFGLVYPAVVDEGALQGEYSINGLPVHVFIDRQGVIRKMVAGEMSKAQIAAAIRAIL